MKKDNRHAILKKQQLKMTPYNQKCLVRDYLDGMPLDKITGGAGGEIRKDQKIKGKAVETEVYKLFVGGFKCRGKWRKKEPLFDKMFNRTGHPYHHDKRERRMIILTTEHKREISMVSRLTGRTEEEIREFLGMNKKSLLD